MFRNLGTNLIGLNRFYGINVDVTSQIKLFLYL